MHVAVTCDDLMGLQLRMGYTMVEMREIFGITQKVWANIQDPANKRQPVPEPVAILFRIYMRFQEKLPPKRRSAYDMRKAWDMLGASENLAQPHLFATLFGRERTALYRWIPEFERTRTRKNKRPTLPMRGAEFDGQTLPNPTVANICSLLESLPFPDDAEGKLERFQILERAAKDEALARGLGDLPFTKGVWKKPKRVVKEPSLQPLKDPSGKDSADSE
jgi:hypothetical protein